MGGGGELVCVCVFVGKGRWGLCAFACVQEENRGREGREEREREGREERGGERGGRSRAHAPARGQALAIKAAEIDLRDERYGTREAFETIPLEKLLKQYY